MDAPPILVVDLWPARFGTAHFPRLDGRSAAEIRDAVFTEIAPQSAVVVGDPTVRDELLAGGAKQVRHLFIMRHDLEDLSAPTQVVGLEFRSWCAGDAALLAPAMLAAYNSEHPDAEAADLDQATESLTCAAEDPDNPMMGSMAQVALLGGQPVGAAVVLRSEHPPMWSGPWLQNMFRAPDRAHPGVGAAMLTRALADLSAAGERELGLAVTSTNPARHLYDRVGFLPVGEYWIVVLP